MAAIDRTHRRAALANDWRGWLVLACLACSVGCSVNLRNVRVYADSLVATEGATTPIAGDVQGSCEREQRYRLLIGQRAAQTRAQLERVEQAYDRGLAICAQASGFAKSYGAYHGLVVAYGKALQKLTADDLVDYGDVIEELGKEADGTVKALGEKDLDTLVGAGFEDAATGLAAAIARWTTEAYRRGEVKEAIKEGGPHVETILKGLRTLTIEVYDQQLQAEQQALTMLYALLSRGQTADQTAVLDVQKRRLERDLEERRRGAAELDRRLGALVEANDKLVSAASEEGLDSKELFAELKPVVKDLLGVGRSLGSVKWGEPPEPSVASAQAPATPTAPATTGGP